MARGHEQTVSPRPAEADVGAALGQRNFSDALAVAIEDNHAVVWIAHAPAAPEIAVHIAAETVRRLAGGAGHERAAVGELAAVVDHVEHLDYARIGARLHDVHLA